MEPLAAFEIKETDDPWGGKMRVRYRDLVVEETWETNPENISRDVLFSSTCTQIPKFLNYLSPYSMFQENDFSNVRGIEIDIGQILNDLTSNSKYQGTLKGFTHSQREVRIGDGGDRWLENWSCKSKEGLRAENVKDAL